MSPGTDMAGFLNFQLIMWLAPFFTLNAIYLPVFTPNDYFWENHWQKDKEEKWEAFARVVREIIAMEHGSIELSSQRMEDKLEFKKELKAKKAKKMN